MKRNNLNIIFSCDKIYSTINNNYKFYNYKH